MTNYTELNVYKFSYSLSFYLLTVSKIFGRDFKYTLGENLKNEMINVVLFIWEETSLYDKEDHLDRAKECIEKSRLYIRLLYDLRQITLDNFTKWNISIQSISKQLSGWSKSNSDLLRKS